MFEGSSELEFFFFFFFLECWEGIGRFGTGVTSSYLYFKSNILASGRRDRAKSGDRHC